MRKLMWFTMGFAAACALGAYLGSGLFLGLAVVAVAITIAAVVLRSRLKFLRFATAICIGVVAGFAVFSVYQVWYLAPATALDGNTMSLTAEVSDYSYETTYGRAAEGVLWLEGRRYTAIIYLNEGNPLIPGDRVTGNFRLRCTNGGSDEATYHRGNGVTLLLYSRSEVVTEETEEIPDRYFPAQLRRRLLVTLDRTFPADTAGFAKALLLGERADLDYATNTAFKLSGISHIVAVSGLHVSILFAVVALLCGRRRFLMALIGIPVLVLFAAVAGFTPSVTRACLMQILMLLALLFNKEYDPPTALSFAVLVMLTVNPLVITSASFQLSVGCMAGIFLFSKRISGWLEQLAFWRHWKGKGIRVRLRTWLCGGVGVTLSAMFFTTALVAYYFGAVSLVGVITNLLTLWAVSLIFYGVMAACLLYGIWAGAAAAMGWGISWLIRYVLGVAKLLSMFPLAAVYTKSVYIIWWLVICYALICIFLMARKRQPLVLICCGICSLCIALLCSWVEPMLSDTRMTMLDVGQGQCIILQSEGQTFLIDCGGDSDTASADMAAETLLSQGISRLDGIVVTHYDRDHAGGVGYLLQRIPADAVFLPESPDEDGILEEILPYCRGAEIFVNEDHQLAYADTSISIFAPILSSTDNERGLCVLFEGEKCDILITGDLSSLGEKLLLREKDIQDLTALVVGHHGSKTSTCQALLDAATPEYALISVGADNYYGHPHDDVLERLAQCGCLVYRTDEHGTIIFRR